MLNRMTNTQLIECILGKTCSIIGGFKMNAMNTSVDSVSILKKRI